MAFLIIASPRGAHGALSIHGDPFVLPEKACQAINNLEQEEEIIRGITYLCEKYVASVEAGNIEELSSLYIDLDKSTLNTFKAFFKETEKRKVLFYWDNIVSEQDEKVHVEIFVNIEYKNRRGKISQLLHKYYWVIESQQGERWSVADYKMSDRKSSHVASR